ncbi:sulfite exporter TauE/SafE family protein [Undibacterium sp. TC4M20W]|uniref:sulfite exporter TauE/SafE family protein n=1 Tax=unclassified Undibacterium TaxID=2630295 RepID=UPI003BF21A6C
MLTLPLVFAAMTAGAIGGVHCAGMCGGISALLTKSGKGAYGTAGKIIPIGLAEQAEIRQTSFGLPASVQYQIMLQGGRIFTYMIAGTVLGGLGAAGILFKPYLPVQQIMFVIGNLMLILLGLRVLGLLPRLAIVQNLLAELHAKLTGRLPSLRQVARHPFLVGMGWGCLPCGLLYGVAPFALLSGDAWSGAVLMLVFGLFALPHLLLTQAVMQQAQNKTIMRGLRYLGAAILLGIGGFGLWYFDMKDMPSILCLVPAA